MKYISAVFMKYSSAVFMKYSSAVFMARILNSLSFLKFFIVIKVLRLSSTNPCIRDITIVVKFRKPLL